MFPPSPAGFSRADELIAALDHHSIGDGAGNDVVYVFGVHTDSAGDLWVQVARGEDGHDNLVLHLSPDATVEDAIAALAAIPLRRGHAPRIVPVTHTSDSQTSIALTSRL